MEHVIIELPELLNERLPDYDRRRIERHLAGCPSCQEEWRVIRILADRTRSRPKVPTGYFTELPARILARRMTGRQGRAAAWISDLVEAHLAPAAAGILVVLALFSVSFNLEEGPAPQVLPVSSADAADFVASDEQWTSADLSPIAAELLSVRLLVTRSSEGSMTPGLEDLEQPSVSELIAGLTDDEVESLVNSMTERPTL